MTHTRPIIALPESIDEAGIRLLTQFATVHQYASLAELIAARRDQHTDAIVVRSIHIDAAVMDALPGLAVIGRHGAGLDNIDLASAETRGIVVVNTPRSNTHSVAEYVIGATYFLIKRLGETSHALKSGAFIARAGSLPGQVQRLGLSGTEISSSTMGIVGYGAIGREVARLAEAHGMSIQFYDPYMSADVPIPHTHTRVETLESLLQASDVVTLHVPGDPGAPPLINAERISLMKPTAVLINAARGSIVSIADVHEAITAGKLAGCAIDVFEEEPPVLDEAFMNHPAVLVTPHMAAMTHEALMQMAIDVASFTLEALGVNTTADLVLHTPHERAFSRFR